MAKAVKLLRLAQSSNPHEAALAASRAQELMDRHKLTGLSADLDPDAAANAEPIADFKADLMEGGSHVLDTWKCRLAMTVARQNECKVYGHVSLDARGRKVKGFAIIGRASDAQTVRYLYAWLAREVDRLTDQLCAGYGRVYRNNFRIGCAETVCARLEAARQETVAAVKTEAQAAGSLALVRVERALVRRERQLAAVEAWAKSHLKLRSGGRRSYTADPSAREAGRQAGHRVAMQPVRAHLA